MSSISPIDTEASLPIEEESLQSQETLSSSTEQNLVERMKQAASLLQSAPTQNPPPLDEARVSPLSSMGGAPVSDEEARQYMGQVQELEERIRNGEFPVQKPLSAEEEMAIEPTEEELAAQETKDPMEVEVPEIPTPQIPAGEISDVSYIYLVRDLVNRIVLQLGRSAEKDRRQVDDMKVRYRLATSQAAAIQRALGNAGLYISMASAIPMLLGILAQKPDLGSFFSQQVPSVGGWFTSRDQAKQKEFDALAQLLLAEYNTKTSKTQSESNSKQEVLQLLQTVLNNLKSAAHAG